MRRHNLFEVVDFEILWISSASGDSDWYKRSKRENSMFSMKSPVLWKNYFMQITIAVLFCILGIFVGMSIRNKELIERVIYERAKAQFSSIVLTRRWNADYGGVYVEKKEGMQSNPYLVNPDIETKDGKIYTQKNPALMTREISENAKKEGTFQFHITSLKPLNPHNAADEFETRALPAFERGKMEKRGKALLATKSSSVIWRRCSGEKAK